MHRAMQLTVTAVNFFQLCNEHGLAPVHSFILLSQVSVWTLWQPKVSVVVWGLFLFNLMVS